MRGSFAPQEKIENSRTVYAVHARLFNYKSDYNKVSSYCCSTCKVSIGAWFKHWSKHLFQIMIHNWDCERLFGSVVHSTVNLEPIAQRKCWHRFFSFNLFNFRGRSSRHPARIQVHSRKRNLAGIHGFPSIEIVCCTLSFSPKRLHGFFALKTV